MIASTIPTYIVPLSTVNEPTKDQTQTHLLLSNISIEFRAVMNIHKANSASAISVNKTHLYQTDNTFKTQPVDYISLTNNCVSNDAPPKHESVSRLLHCAYLTHL